MYEEEYAEAAAHEHPKIRFPNVQDHLPDFELVHGYVSQFGLAMGSHVSRLDHIFAETLEDGSKELSYGVTRAGPAKVFATMDETGKVTIGKDVDYDFMAETLRDAVAFFQPRIESDQAFINTLDI